MYAKFEARENFEYGIPAFDEILRGRHSSSSYLIYQEQIMETLMFAGIDAGQTYSIIKAISKKDASIINSAKEQFKIGFMSKTGCDENTINKIWQIIDDNSSYSFNSAHSYSVALDSLYNAWLKVDYPYEFYETCLALYSGELDEDTKKDKDKISALIKEMGNFGIQFGELKFGNDNRSFRADKENKVIYPSLLSVKYMNHDVAELIYQVSKTKTYDNFSELYMVLKEMKGINKRHIETLIKINYFKDFGKRKKLLQFVELADGVFSKKTYSKEKCPANILNVAKVFAKDGHEDSKKMYRNIDFVGMYNFILSTIPDNDIGLLETFQNEWDLTGNILSQIPIGCSIGIISAKSHTKNWMLFKSLKNNSETWIQTRVPASKIPKKESVIMLHNVERVENKRAKRIDYVSDFEIIKEA